MARITASGLVAALLIAGIAIGAQVAGFLQAVATVAGTRKGRARGRGRVGMKRSRHGGPGA